MWVVQATLEMWGGETVYHASEADPGFTTNYTQFQGLTSLNTLQV